jgi:hypothetical protein
MLLKEKITMKNGIIAIFCGALLCFGAAMSANAGQIDDTDSDSVPDVFDNCVFTPNGPGAATGQCDDQEDTRGAGFGNPCDGDFNDSGLVDGQDFTDMSTLFLFPGNAGDLNCSGLTDGQDFTAMFGRLFKVPGAL